MIEARRPRVREKKRRRYGERAGLRPGVLTERGKRGLIVSIVIITVAVHGLGLALFGLLKMAEYFKEPEASFFMEKKQVVIPAPTREQQMNMARHRAMAPRPVFSERLVSRRPIAFALPELPKLPLDQMIPLDPSELISDQLASLSVSAGMGIGTGKGLLGSGGLAGSGMSFFNINDNARSVVIMIDVSASMFGRTGDLDYGTGKLVRRGKEQAFQIIRNEAFALIDSLSINTLFGIIHWSGSARLWKEALVPATPAHRALAKEHIQTRVDYNKAGPLGGRPGGTRHDYALEALFRMQPETAFMLTDGNATRSLGRGKFEVIETKELLDLIDAAEVPRIPRIHTIYYVTGKDDREEEKMLRGLARKTQGKFRKQKAASARKKGR